jgi:hypothetical protein
MTEGPTDDPQWRHLEPLNLQVGDKISIDGPITFIVGKDAGRVRLIFSGWESSDVLVRTKEGQIRRLQSVRLDASPPLGT